MDVSGSYFRQVIKGRLAEICRRNSAYSMRSFAKKLDISVSTLSRVLAGKRSLPVKYFEKIASQVTNSDEEKALFVESAARDFQERLGARAVPEAELCDIDFIDGTWE